MASLNKQFKVLKHHKSVLVKNCAVYPRAKSLAPISLKTSVIIPSLLVGQGESPVPLHSQYITNTLASKPMYKEK
jgi:hypothetical protein